MSDEGFIYTLELQDGCYYVGYSADPETRIASHFLGRGAQWTRLHPPISVLSVRAGDQELENVTTIAMMVKYGWRMVRGGAYLTIQMQSPPPPILKAYSLKSPPALPEQVEAEVLCGHSLLVLRVKDAGPYAWRASISGRKAAAECPKRGFKMLHAESEDELRSAVEKWLEGEGDGYMAAEQTANEPNPTESTATKSPEIEATATKSPELEATATKSPELEAMEATAIAAEVMENKMLPERK